MCLYTFTALMVEVERLEVEVYRCQHCLESQVDGRGPIGVSGGMAPSESSPLLYDESESSLLLSKCIFGGRGGVLELWATRIWITIVSF